MIAQHSQYLSSHRHHMKNCCGRKAPLRYFLPTPAQSLETMDGQHLACIRACASTAVLLSWNLCTSCKFQWPPSSGRFCAACPSLRVRPAFFFVAALCVTPAADPSIYFRGVHCGSIQSHGVRRRTYASKESKQKWRQQDASDKGFNIDTTTRIDSIQLEFT